MVRSFPVVDFDTLDQSSPYTYSESRRFLAWAKATITYPAWAQRRGTLWFYTLKDGQLLCLSLGEDDEYNLTLLDAAYNGAYPKLLVFADEPEAMAAFDRLDELLMQEAL